MHQLPIQAARLNLTLSYNDVLCRPGTFLILKGQLSRPKKMIDNFTYMSQYLMLSMEPFKILNNISFKIVILTVYVSNRLDESDNCILVVIRII